MDIYCVKCKARTPTKNVTETTTKKGQPMLKGTCEVCGTRKGKFIPKKK